MLYNYYSKTYGYCKVNPRQVDAIQLLFRHMVISCKEYGYYLSKEYGYYLSKRIWLLIVKRIWLLPVKKI